MEQVVKQNNLPCVHLSSLESNYLVHLQGLPPLSPVVPCFQDLCLELVNSYLQSLAEFKSSKFHLTD